jgi:hypothetical protein
VLVYRTRTRCLKLVCIILDKFLASSDVVELEFPSHQYPEHFIEFLDNEVFTLRTVFIKKLSTDLCLSK